MAFRIVPIVEGHGEEAAVPVLFRRVIAALNLAVPIDVAHPIRQARGTLLKQGGIERAVGLAAIEIGESGTIFILLDSEGECPAELVALLAARAQDARGDKRISVVLAHQEFEAWFLASASSLRGTRGLSANVSDHDNPESVRGCKEWLENWLPPTSRYSETTDQAALTARFDMALAKKARSFRKLWKEIEKICHHAQSLDPA
ncbi:MAG: DUF4276 family protein [Acidobacteriia bacterium]|nr:DUF4276 family protein [Terriglobia bacterium]